jgi:hypothetical protein
VTVRNTGTAALQVASARATVSLRGQGSAAPVVEVPAIEVTPASLAFGTVTIGQAKDLTLTVRNAGGGVLAVSQMQVPLGAFSPFSLVSPTAPFTLAGGASQSVTVRFAASAAGNQSGSLTIASNDPARPSVSVALSGTGVTASQTSQTLKVDDGTFENSLGLSGSALAGFVNRLTPPRYPATLKEVQVYFPAYDDALKTGDSFSILVGAVPSTAADLSGVSFEVFTARVVGTGAWNTYTLPDKAFPSGDVVVGIGVTNKPEFYPMAVDTTPPSQKRSWVSGDWRTWQLVDSLPGMLGNFAIRATVAAP